MNNGNFWLSISVIAIESKRKSPIAVERNNYVKDLLEKAAANSKVAAHAKP